MVCPPYWGSLDFWLSVRERKIFLEDSLIYAHLPVGLLNRMVVEDAKGIRHVLSFPIKGGRRTRQCVRDVQIDYVTNWQKQHLATLQSCYGRCLFWEEYHSAIRQLVMSNHKFLIDFNDQICKWLGDFVDLPQMDSSVESPIITDENTGSPISKTNELSILHGLMYRY